MSYTVKYTKPEKKEPVKYVLMQEEPKKIKVDVLSGGEKAVKEPLKKGNTIFSYVKDKAQEEKQLMKHIALTTEEAVDLDMYFALTHQRITDEIETWESLKDNPTAPAAGKNLIFWKKMESLINKVSKKLQ